MQLGVLRVPALVHERLGRLVGHPDLHELLRVRMGLAEVRAQSALSVIDVLHGVPPVEIGVIAQPSDARDGAPVAGPHDTCAWDVPFGTPATGPRSTPAAIGTLL